jgi:hypothetical protein
VKGILGGSRSIHGGYILLCLNMKKQQRLDSESEIAKEPKSVTVSFIVPVALLAQIDRLASDEHRSRGNAMRLLLEEALRQRILRCGDSGCTIPFPR